MRPKAPSMKMTDYVGDMAPECVLVEVPRGTHTEGAILSKIGERLMLGYEQYGAFDKSFDRRNWVQEALEEILDGMVYVAKKLIELQVQSAATVLADAERPTTPSLPDFAEDGREVCPLGFGDGEGGSGEADASAVSGSGGESPGTRVVHVGDWIISK